MKISLVLLMSVSLGALAAEPVSKCQVLDESVLSRTPSGVVVVSNVKVIEMSCTAPARPFPTKPGEGIYGLRAETIVFEIASDGSKKLVASEAHGQGGGRGMFGATPEEEFVTFYVLIPLELAVRDAEIRRYLTRFEAAASKDLKMSDSERVKMRERMQYLSAHPEEMAVIMNQHRLGRFQIECRVMDGKTVRAKGSAEVEVVFKGRISDAFPPEEEQRR